MQTFITMLEKNPDYLPAILGMATGFMYEKNQHKYCPNPINTPAPNRGTSRD
jgi:hypothetical protein